MNNEHKGRLTGAALDSTAPFVLPFSPDPWGVLRPPVSVEALQMSAELASAVYRMDLEDWMQAGWTDVTVQLEDDLVPLTEKQGRFASLRSKHILASRLGKAHPVRQALDTLRQIDTSTTGKAAVMIHPAPDGRYVVAVSFMGTGSRLSDWVSNLRLTAQDGIHKGFLQLTRQFESNEDRILFPETAKQLQLERLSLRDILKEMRHPNSRFQLWLSGHSQGAALMQLYAHCKLQEDGVQMRHLMGYGFAAPSVMTGGATVAPAAYPLYLVQCSEDVVTRCGGHVHLGVCLTYPADDALRSACYPLDHQPLACRARQVVRPLFALMQDTPSCIECAIALLSVLSHSGEEDLRAALESMGIPLVGKALDAGYIQQILRAITRRASAAYQSWSGKPLSQQRIAMIAQGILPGLKQIGMKAYFHAMVEMFRFPHSIAGSHPGGFTGTYIWIAQNGISRLQPSVWAGGDRPFRMAPPEDVTQDTITLTGPAYMRRHRTKLPRRPARKPHKPMTPPRRNTRRAIPELLHGSLQAGETMVRIRE
ncbi:MAG: hypothetical protein E7333_07045 [Clostridiales bacterium]|nr:hypothetical protein [Clostridiales bacterium]